MLVEEGEFDGYDLDLFGRVIDPEIESGEKITILETEDFHLTYEQLEYGDLVVPNVHCWVYRWTPRVKAELQTALHSFGPHVACAPLARPKLNKFIQLLGYEYVEEVEANGEPIALYQWRH